MSTFERVKQICIDHLGVAPNDIRESSSFIDDLGTDSLDLVELVMAAEEEFDVDISDDDAESFLLVSDAVRFIDKRLAE